jgi:PD-(D/E)XK endonuclease
MDSVRSTCEHMFVSEAGLTPTQKGNVAEAAITLAAVKLGIGVLKPVQEGLRYDLMFDFHPTLARVQCKWARREGDVLIVNLTSSRTTPNGYVKTYYRADEVDAVAAYSPDLDRCFYIPIDLIAEQRAIQLRLTPARNGQWAAIRWAEKYDLGAVAQLGERRRGTPEVVGSSPISSTSSPAPSVLGAEAFRDGLGHWMERAAGGEEILVTRRGRPHVRVGPP